MVGSKKIHFLYEVKIFEKESKNNDYHYKNNFIGHADAIDQCNTEFFKLKDKNKYDKKIEMIPYR